MHNWELDGLLKQFTKEEVLESSVSVSELMRQLSKLPPDARILVTQDGYYCEHPLAQLYQLHPYDAEKWGGLECYVLGHSSQYP